MNEQVGGRQSIRRRLLLFLIPSQLLVIAGVAALTYWVALYVATSSYDRSLLDPVLDMAANVHMEAGEPRLALLAQAQEALLYDHEDTLIFQIRAADGSVVAGEEALQASPKLRPGERTFFDGKYLGQPVRIAAMRSDSGFYIQVGETLNKRKRLIWEILAVGLTPTLLIAGATLVLAWTGVAHGLAPLDRARTELLRRTPQDLRALDEASAPLEIAPAIAALNRLLGQLRESSALQQRFLADAAHQLRTPLAGLQMHLELLLRRDLGHDIRDELEGMRAATVRASHLANQLLALAKAEAITDQTDRIELVDLYAVADRAVHEWVPQAIERGIDLGFVLEHANVLGNPILLGELLDNLIDNALRYTPADGTVTVRCGAAAGQPYLSVEDTGPGIPEWAHARVFERFFRLQGTPGDGAGLGLAIVKEVAQKHGATLRIENQPEHGTRIVIRFPPPAVAGS